MVEIDGRARNKSKQERAVRPTKAFKKDCEYSKPFETRVANKKYCSQ